jgi:hypothetical protein
MSHGPAGTLLQHLRKLMHAETTGESDAIAVAFRGRAR